MIKLFGGNEWLELKFWTFPGGEGVLHSTYDTDYTLIILKALGAIK